MDPFGAKNRAEFFDILDLKLRDPY